MSSGAGRGRGWLNLAKNSEPPRPGGLNSPPVNSTPYVASQPEAVDYQELIKRINTLDISDDGIKFNQKLQYIREYWLKECKNGADVERSFEALYKACLCDIDLASKLVFLVAARTFLHEKIYEVNLRHLFLKHLQTDFENSNQLQSSNPQVFRNCVHMIGEFFSKARTAVSGGGSPYKFLATPFKSCLDLLLESKAEADLSLFTTQLYLNWPNLRHVLPDDTNKLINRIRTILTETQLPKKARIWLLLALELSHVRFAVLPVDIYKYYEDQIGSKEMLNFQRSHDILSVETVHKSKILDSYQSNVNVLQISTSPTDDIQYSQFSDIDYNNVPPNASFPAELQEKPREKTGRPILGSGARLHKTKDENWKQNSASGRSGKKGPPTLKTNKGWEHDDRFENDYN